MKIKYDYVVTDIDALQKYAPNAVIITKKAIRSKITNMLDAGCKVEGIELLDNLKTEEAPKPVLPTFYKRSGD